MRSWLIEHREENGRTETEPTFPEGTRLKELAREVQELETEAQLLEKRWPKYRAGAEAESRNDFTASKKTEPTSQILTREILPLVGRVAANLSRP